MRSSGQVSELEFFSTLVAAGSLTAAARAVGVSTAAVSKRLAALEQRLGTPLVIRTTRRMQLTSEGEAYLLGARRILSEMDDLEQSLVALRSGPRGALRINSSPGFGRRYVAPAASAFLARYPEVRPSLVLTVDPPPMADDLFDLYIRLGPPPDARVIARRLAGHRRVLCASPAYLARHGAPASPAELAHHVGIILTQGDDAYGIWRLDGDTRERVRLGDSLQTNDGDVAVQWALSGHGILMRAQWDVAGYLADGRLCEVLPHCRTPVADIYAYYPQQHQASMRTRLFIDCLAQSLAGEPSRWACSPTDLAADAAATAGTARCLPSTGSMQSH